MDPATIAAFMAEAYKIGGVVLVVLVIMAFGTFFVYRDGLKRERRMSLVIDRCQNEHVELSKSGTAAIVNNNLLVKDNTDATKALTAILRERPCLIDRTPPYGQHHTPRPH